MVREGVKAADFALKGVDENGEEKEYSLNTFKGKPFVLYFYPKDNTPGCTQEACDFRDNMARLLSKGILVIGVSPDSLSSHKNFKKKHSIPYPLLSDPEKKTASLYGAYGEKTIYGKKSVGTLRSTFLIDKDGKVEKAWVNVKAAGHVDEVLKTIG